MLYVLVSSRQLKACEKPNADKNIRFSIEGVASIAYLSRVFICYLWLQILLIPEANHGKAARVYDNPDHGYYNTWASLSSPEQEAAEVFMLGKVLWCIFEGVISP